MVFRTFAFISGLLIATTSVAETITYEQAKKAGIKRCLPVIKKTSDFLVKQDAHGASSNWATEETDKQIFSSFIEHGFNDNTTEIINLIVVPTVSGQCAFSYTRTFYSEQSCLALSKDIYSEYEFKGEVNKNATKLVSKNGGGDAYLMSVGTGCLSIRHEIDNDAN
ncbi:MAG TPA: hypothetical protein VN247_00425 [Arenimonas sp.]|nr:hypothetical protein [Arenimonas sp.]